MQLIEIFFNKNNLSYALYVLMIKALFKIYSFIITDILIKIGFMKPMKFKKNRIIK